MQILKFPDPLLFKRCDEVSVFGQELLVLLEAMFETMKTSKGIGLAANQVGLLQRMFVMEGPSQEKIYLVNPVILKKSAGPANVKEGCLSAPGDFMVISSRAAWTQVQFQDETGKEHVRVFSGLWSVCVQHEIEHLNGESFLENKTLTKIKRKELAKKWKLSK